MFNLHQNQKAKFTGLSVLVLWVIGAVSSAQASQLQDVKFSELSGGRFEVRLDFDQAPAEPTGYTIEQPARIVLDFAGVGNALQQRKFSLPFDNAKSALVLSSNDRTRLILNLSKLSAYKARSEGNSYFVVVGQQLSSDYISQSDGAANSVLSSSSVGTSSRQIEANSSVINNVDFRRSEEGEGKVIISLSDPSVNIDVEQKNDQISISFLGAELPSELRRSLDVTDFATPVSKIVSDYDGKNTTVIIDVAGDYDYLAYQADNEYVVSVKPLTEQELEEKKSVFAFVGDKLSLNFQNIEVRSVLQLIADFTEMNLVASDSVRGNITLRLENVPWDQALDLVLKTKGLDKRLIGNVLMVAPAAEIAQRERQELNTRKQLEELAPLQTEYIRVRYANAKDVFKLFKGNGGKNSTDSILSGRGSAIVDLRTNSIILTDTADNIEEFKRLVDQIDIPIQQVMIEARLVIATSDLGEELGISWGVAGGHTSANGVTQVDGNLLVDLGVAGAAGTLALTYLDSNVLLGMELSALESQGFAELVSQPKVITGDKQKATIESGKEIPYLQSTSSGAAAIKFKKAVLKLDVTPQITPDGNIIMDLKINQDSEGSPTSTGVPTINTTKLETQVLVSNGQTVVLGGIFETTVVESETKVPLLGDIPLVGNLFRNKITGEEKRELLIFITPSVLSDALVR